MVGAKLASTDARAPKEVLEWPDYINTNGATR